MAQTTFEGKWNQPQPRDVPRVEVHYGVRLEERLERHSGSGDVWLLHISNLGIIELLSKANNWT